MFFSELVSYIVKHFDSCYLVPLSEKYDTNTWNAAMGEAMYRLELVDRINLRKVSNRTRNLSISCYGQEVLLSYAPHGRMERSANKQLRGFDGDLSATFALYRNICQNPEPAEEEVACGKIN